MRSLRRPSDAAVRDFLESQAALDFTYPEVGATATTPPRGYVVDHTRIRLGGGEEAFRNLLYAPEMHDPDLIIRTSGERRLSNYLMWQSAYSELVFRDELWPDFDRAAFEAALAEYGERRRRFGGR